MNCKYCGKTEATAEDYKTIPEGQGEHLCWASSGYECVSAEEALDTARERIAALEAELAKAQRIYTRCPACNNDTLTNNDGHLLCTWHECPDPTLIAKAREPRVCGLTFDAFVEVISKCGWYPRNDAQYDNIRRLWNNWIKEVAP